MLGLLNGILSMPFALAVVLGILRRTNQFIGPSILVSVLCAAFGSLVLLMAEVSDEPTAAWLGSISPISGLIASNAGSFDQQVDFLMVSAGVGVCGLIYLVHRAVPLYGRLRAPCALPNPRRLRHERLSRESNRELRYVPIEPNACERSLPRPLVGLHSVRSSMGTGIGQKFAKHASPAG